MADEKFTPSAGPAPVQKFSKNIIPWVRSRKNAEYEAEYNAAMANWNLQNQIDLMNYQNAYNSPAEQMARYSEAGINPNYAASDAGNMSASVSSEGRSVDSSQVEDPLDTIERLVDVAGKVASVGSGIQGFVKTAVDIQNTQAATDLARLQKILEQGRYDIDLGRYHMDKTTREGQDAMLLAQLRNQLMQNATYYTRFQREGSLNDAQIRKINSDIQRSDALLPYEKESYRLRNVFQGYENYLRKGDVDFDNYKDMGKIRRLAQMSISEDQIPFFLSVGLADETSNSINRGVQVISDGFNKASSAYNRLVNGISKKVVQVSNQLLDAGKSGAKKYYKYSSQYGLNHY